MRIKDGQKIHERDSQIKIIRDNYYLLHYLIIQYENGMTLNQINAKFPHISYINLWYFFKKTLEIEKGRHSNRRYEVWNQIQEMKEGKRRSMQNQFELYKLMHKLDDRI